MPKPMKKKKRKKVTNERCKTLYQRWKSPYRWFT